MAVTLCVLTLSLLLHGCVSSPEQTDSGCMTWKKQGDNVCCDACHPGNRLVSNCGPDPKELCTPCAPQTYTVKPKEYKCDRCTRCVGAQIQLKECTATSDTKCGCKEGLECGNDRCTFCVKRCGKGEEPTDTRSCRPCPKGTFNDQIHQKCKPWSTGCPNPNEVIDKKGDAVSDIKCVTVHSLPSVTEPKQPGHKYQVWPLVSFVITSIALLAFLIIFTTLKIHHKLKTNKKPKPLPKPPTDDPRTLIAIECSFHEAQQEQGSSSESLASKDSSEQLIG